MLVNAGRYSDRSNFTQRIGRITGTDMMVDERKRDLENINNDISSPNNYTTTNMNNISVYHDYKNPRFTNSNTSVQSTLMSQNTKYSSTVASSISQSDYEIIPEVPIETLRDIESNMEDYTHKPRRNSITSSIKIGKHFNNSKNSSKYSIHSCKKTSVKNVPKNNIVLINNMPYPVQLHFPAKISNRKSKESLNIPNVQNKENFHSVNNNYIKTTTDSINDSISIQSPEKALHYNNTNTHATFIESSFPTPTDLETCKSNLISEKDSFTSDTYDVLLQLIQSYID